MAWVMRATPPPPGPRRRVEIRFAGGERFVAALLDGDAPRTCATFWGTLPFEAEALHATASGYALWHPVGFWAGAVEHPLVYGAQPGDLLLNSQTLPVTIHGGALVPQEVYIAYGPVIFFNFSGWFPMAHFGRIVEGELETLRAVGTRIHRRGREAVAYRRVDD